MAYSEIYLPKSDLDEYHVNREFYQPIDALDIKKTNQTWIAILKCDSKYGVKTRIPTNIGSSLHKIAGQIALIFLVT